MEHCYIEGHVLVTTDAKINIVNSHVLAVADEEKKTRSRVSTMLGSCTNVVGSLLTAEPRLGHEVDRIGGHLSPAVEFYDKTLGQGFT